MALTNYDDILSDTHAADGILTSAEYDALMDLIGSQLPGALVALGVGVISGLQITAGSGLTANCSAGAAIIQTTGDIAFGSVGGVALTGLPDSTAHLYFWAQALTPGSGGDTRLSGVLVIVYTTVNTPPVNSVALASGHTSGGVFVVDADARVYCPARAGTALGDAVTALQAAETTLAARVTVLESGGSGGVPASWGGMPKAYGTDATTIDQSAAAQIAAAKVIIDAEIAAIGGGSSTPPSAFDIDAANQGLALLTEILQDNVTAGALLRDCVIIVPGKWGDSSGGSIDNVDRSASTWTTGLATP